MQDQITINEDNGNIAHNQTVKINDLIANTKSKGKYNEENK